MADVQVNSEARVEKVLHWQSCIEQSYGGWWMSFKLATEIDRREPNLEWVKHRRYMSKGNLYDAVKVPEPANEVSAKYLIPLVVSLA